SLFLISCLICPTPAPTFIYTLSLHDALPIFYFVENVSRHVRLGVLLHVIPFILFLQFIRPFFPFHIAAQHKGNDTDAYTCLHTRSEEHTSELQSRFDLVCRLLLEKKTTRTTQ